MRLARVIAGHQPDGGVVMAPCRRWELAPSGAQPPGDRGRGGDATSDSSRRGDRPTRPFPAAGAAPPGPAPAGPWRPGRWRSAPANQHVARHSPHPGGGEAGPQGIERQAEGGPDAEGCPGIPTAIQRKAWPVAPIAYGSTFILPAAPWWACRHWPRWRRRWRQLTERQAWLELWQAGRITATAAPGGGTLPRRAGSLL